MNDRETPGYTASEYVNSIIGCLRHCDRPSNIRNTAFGQAAIWEPRKLVTHIAYLEGARVQLDPTPIEVRLHSASWRYNADRALVARHQDCESPGQHIWDIGGGDPTVQYRGGSVGDGQGDGGPGLMCCDWNIM